MYYLFSYKIFNKEFVENARAIWGFIQYQNSKKIPVVAQGNHGGAQAVGKLTSGLGLGLAAAGAKCSERLR